ncbi:MAG: acyltransferase family protein [Clostridium sp.]|jgi:surface polysaccharide O-acyltransferase-like enzyme|nr:acyltransferase family protein [Clostridium sp.]
METKVKPTQYLNILRVWACFAVIIFHLSGSIFVAFRDEMSSLEFILFARGRHFWSWNIPIFLMISGVLFLNPAKKIPLKKLFTRYISRILLALFLFGFGYAFLELFYESHFQFEFIQLAQALGNVIQGKVWVHLWYLYLIFGIYLLLPLLKPFAEHVSQTTYAYILIVLFLFAGLVPIIEIWANIEIGFEIPLASLYVLYFLLGHYLHYYDIHIKNVIGIMILIIYTFCIFILPLERLDHNILTPLIILAASAIFVLVRQTIKTDRGYAKITLLCFGVYLIHQLFIHILFEGFENLLGGIPLFYVFIAGLVAVSGLSFLFTFVARKIKIVRDYLL